VNVRFKGAIGVVPSQPQVIEKIEKKISVHSSALARKLPLNKRGRCTETPPQIGGIAKTTHVVPDRHRITTFGVSPKS